ncbi:MAG: decarboxylating 6-phosphogluconate dehydrogenase [Bradyrhizobium sp.]|jgi:6-phosphogluconate dehydrogenase|nr:decarboxylating 6-phosphogluconate dehydrogenase [Bradyrhizobium sp.]
MVGLGRMGGNIVRRVLRTGHACVAYDRDPKLSQRLSAEGAFAAQSLKDLVAIMERPRHVWLMLPAGEATEETLHQLSPILNAGDVLIDGGNSFYKDDIRRARELAAMGLHHVDVGTSGGIERGYCLMIGGEKEIVDRLDPIFSVLATGSRNIPCAPGREGRDGRVERGYVHAGSSGAGHFVKMVHSGIEYGLMQAYAEGFEILKQASAKELPADLRFDLDLADVAEAWRRGGAISSWLLDLTASALAADPKLSNFEGYGMDSGDGRWAINAVIEEAVPVPVLSAALYARFGSRQQNGFANKLLSAMRNNVGGHQEPARA